MEIKHTIPEWCAILEKDGVHLNPKTLNRRRLVTGLGELTGPKKRYLLTKEEFAKVVNTPLPQCNAVMQPLAV
jgi:hypothetical protein